MGKGLRYASVDLTIIQLDILYIAPPLGATLPLESFLDKYLQDGMKWNLHAASVHAALIHFYF